MIERKRCKDATRAFYARAEYELAKLVRKGIAFQQSDREKRAMKLGLPISVRDPKSDHAERKARRSIEDACCHLCDRLLSESSHWSFASLIVLQRTIEVT
jgi:hypothetical protein